MYIGQSTWRAREGGWGGGVLIVMHGRSRMTIGGRTHWLLALVIRRLTTYPFRDGAPFLLIIETPRTFLGAHLRFFPHVKQNMLTFSISCFAFCAHHLSPGIAIVFSLLSTWYRIKFLHITFVYLTHLQHIPFPLVYFKISYNVGSTLIFFATRAQLCIFLLPTTGIPVFFLAGSGPLHEIAVSSYSRA